MTVTAERARLKLIYSVVGLDTGTLLMRCATVDVALRVSRFFMQDVRILERGKEIAIVRQEVVSSLLPLAVRALKAGKSL